MPSSRLSPALVALSALLALPAAAQAGDLTRSGRTLTYTAAPGEANRVVVTAARGSVTVSEGAGAVTGCTLLSPDRARCDGSFTRVRLRLGDRNDTARVQGVGAVADGGGAPTRSPAAPSATSSAAARRATYCAVARATTPCSATPGPTGCSAGWEPTSWTETRATTASMAAAAGTPRSASPAATSSTRSTESARPRTAAPRTTGPGSTGATASSSANA